MSYHTVSTLLAKSSSLKRFVFSKMEKKKICAWLSLAASVFTAGGWICLLFEKRKKKIRNELDQTKLNLLNPNFYSVVSLLFDIDGVNASLKNQVYFEGAIGDLKKKKKKKFSVTIPCITTTFHIL